MPRFIATLELEYEGDEPVTPNLVHALLASTLDHCRQEGMLSEPQWESTGCDHAAVIDVEAVS